MSRLTGLWRKLTVRAMDQSTGKLEAAFFESIYRITYASGLSLSDNQSLKYRVYKYIIKVMIILMFSCEVLNLFTVPYSLDTFINNINVTVIHILIMYRYKCMEDSRQVYKHLAKSMDSSKFDVSTPDRERIFLHWKQINDKYYKVLLSLAICTLIVWYTYPLVDDEEYNLVVSVYVPFEYRTPQLYAVAYFVTLMLFHCISCFVAVNDLMMQTYLIHMICQFAVLRNSFESILVDCGADINCEIFKDRYLQRLGALVEQHQFILNNALKLRAILSRPMLGQLTASGVLICAVGYQVTATATESIPKFLLSLLYLSYNLYGFYIVCRWCDEIKEQSENISQAVYFSGWERGAAIVPGVRVRLMLVVLRANKPLILSAGGLYDVSLQSYTTLVKTSYSALTVLLRMRQH